MKKLVLKKDVVARINDGEMHQLRGGGLSNYVCVNQSIEGHTCDGGLTCNTCDQHTCPAVYSCEQSCLGSCNATCQTCHYTCVTTTVASCENDCTRACLG